MIKAGTKVRVPTMIGVVTSGLSSQGCQRVSYDNDSIELAWVKPERLEVLAEPLKVGDVVTEDTPEPPVGTVIFEDRPLFSRVWYRRGEGWLVVGDPVAYAWPDIMLVRSATFIVLRVGGES